MTVDDALDMVQVGSPLMSPDGSWVLYSRRTLNWEDNEYETEYWRVPADGGEAFRYIGEDGGSAFQFSPDGAYLTVSAQRAERSNASNNYNAKKAISSGSLIIVTEGGHLYTLNGNSGLVGLGKNERSGYAQLMVQRVNMEIGRASCRERV